MSKRNFLKIFLPIACCLVFGLLIKEPQAQILLGPQNSVIGPNDLTLIWSSKSYVPPQYQGKALPSRGSKITVAALPVKKLTVNPETYYYNWVLDGDIAGYANGRGNISFIFTASAPGNSAHQVELAILNSEGFVLNKYAVSIPIVEPQAVLWQSETGYAAKDTFVTSPGRTINFTAVPLFFNIKSPADINFDWYFADQQLTSPDQKDADKLSLKIPAGELAQSLIKTLKVILTNKNDRLQQISNVLNIEIKNF